MPLPPQAGECEGGVHVGSQPRLHERVHLRLTQALEVNLREMDPWEDLLAMAQVVAQGQGHEDDGSE